MSGDFSKSDRLRYVEVDALDMLGQLSFSVQTTPTSESLSDHIIHKTDLAHLWSRLPQTPGRFLSYLDPITTQRVHVVYLWDFEKFCDAVDNRQICGILSYACQKHEATELDFIDRHRPTAIRPAEYVREQRPATSGVNKALQILSANKDDRRKSRLEQSARASIQHSRALSEGSWPEEIVEDSLSSTPVEINLNRSRASLDSFEEIVADPEPIGAIRLFSNVRVDLSQFDTNTLNQLHKLFQEPNARTDRSIQNSIIAWEQRQFRDPIDYPLLHYPNRATFLNEIKDFYETLHFRNLDQVGESIYLWRIERLRAGLERVARNPWRGSC